MNTEKIDKIVSTLKHESRNWLTPSVTMISVQTKDPFRILISTLLSLRTQDKTTIEASKRLFTLATTPKTMLKLKSAQIEKLIYPVGFYRTKARRILEICEVLEKQYDGKTPDSIEELLKLKGVGRKTANLVVILGYGKPGICVDTHVHRISNRLGIVKTKTPEKTEFALRKILPQKHWLYYNDVLVGFGQNLCKPISPHCTICPVRSLCPRIGVTHSR